MTTETRFLLNDRSVTATEPPGLPVLDWLRRRRRLTGTKEGCKEGDCGACVVLVGELSASGGTAGEAVDGDRVRYRSMTSCLMPLGELAGKHLVTIEGLGDIAELTPVQQAIVEEGASQCGFCTPGIVVSMTGLLMRQGARLDRDAVKTALSGHLCRCTGYRSLKAAGDTVCRVVGERTGMDALLADGYLPEYFRGIPARLHTLGATPASPAAVPGVATGATPSSPAVFIAGGTDLYVQQGEDLTDARLDLLNLPPGSARLGGDAPADVQTPAPGGQKGIERRDGYLRVGALVTHEDFAQHPEARRRIPEIEAYMSRIASLQVRNRATLGGNVINASPIGDMTVLLLALDSQLVLRDVETSRTVPMTSFYQGYKVIDIRPGEVLGEILIPELEPGSLVSWEKVSKRKFLDIASVNSAIEIRTGAGTGTVAGVRLAVGGVAPIPLELKATREYLLGRAIDAQTVLGALAIAQGEISPISDVRGSADYKRLLTRQLLIAHFTRLFPDRLRVSDFHREPS